MDVLLEGVDVLARHGDPTSADVTSVEFDSRRVVPGALFCCLPGAVADGHDHAGDALARGAVALLCERPLPLDVPQAQVAPGRARPVMAQLAAVLAGRPAGRLTTVGVTGTNGKTTVTQMLAAILRAGGRPSVAIGTLDGARTTPEAPDLQRRLAAYVDDGIETVALEVSSHALVQARVDAICFDLAVFTNLSHDHLDYHGTMDDYFEAKASLFTPERARRGVVWTDDPWGARLVDRTGIPTVAVHRGEATDVTLAVGRTTFCWRGEQVTMATTGRYNVDNALLAAAAAVELGMTPAEVTAGLGAVSPVPGRMEVVATGGAGGPSGAPFSVLVDYAHTPAGLEVALSTARELAPGRVVVVFGAGGDRDREKRPVMGRVATEMADIAVLTNDNPRSEDPAAIIDEVRAGAVDRSEASGRLVVEPDRAAAIGRAIEVARPGDIVVIAGKGHETGQQVGSVVTDFDDRLVARSALAERGWAAETGPAGSAVLGAEVAEPGR